MKKIIIHSVPVIVCWLWLMAMHHTYNPVSLKGPDFLVFYLILLTGFYASLLFLKQEKKTGLKTFVSFIVLLFGLGVVKLVRGLWLGKPIGFLLLILFMECIAGVVLIKSQLNNSTK
ncbi:hypothetical protein [Chryseobacterium sp.]|uniref:hypothetical protein n=1 Tax=Chryseobacterium sp. TaxID=1871047 RepID=UPI0025BFC92B|nr:hypothetical protein [Chryseobacterium sp.]MBV8327058.1 hypothetical protein [Chryseobacterium sp.]